MQELKIATDRHTQLVEITAQVRDAIRAGMKATDAFNRFGIL